MVHREAVALDRLDHAAHPGALVVVRHPGAVHVLHVAARFWVSTAERLDLRQALAQMTEHGGLNRERRLAHQRQRPMRAAHDRRVRAEEPTKGILIDERGAHWRLAAM